MPASTLEAPNGIHNNQSAMNMITTALEERLDQEYLVDTLTHLMQVPTEVPLGTNTLMEPDDRWSTTFRTSCGRSSAAWALTT